MISFFVWVWMCAPYIFLSCATNTFAYHTQKSHSFFLSFIAVLFGENEMSMVFFHIHSPSCEHHYTWPYTKCYSFALYPILCLFCHTNCLLEKPLKKFSSGTLERQNFHALLLGIKKFHCYGFEYDWTESTHAYVEIGMNDGVTPSNVSKCDCLFTNCTGIDERHIQKAVSTLPTMTSQLFMWKQNKPYYKR